MKELIEYLKKQPKEVLLMIVFELMKDGKLSFADITKAHIEHLEMLKKGATEDYMDLQSRLVCLWSGKKKDRDASLKSIMHYLLDKGRINTTHEAIDKK